ncbi:Uncharacterised protein [Mycobacteroides abscessus subsp. abscessus]|nr:Uncharacterised protein [Mycobacteroides abscessus subsp. abscessus]
MSARYRSRPRFSSGATEAGADSIANSAGFAHAGSVSSTRPVSRSH